MKWFVLFALIATQVFATEYVFVYPENKYGNKIEYTNGRAKRGDVVCISPLTPTELEKEKFIIFEVDSVPNGSVLWNCTQSDSTRYRIDWLDLPGSYKPGIHKIKSSDIEKLHKKRSQGASLQDYAGTYWESLAGTFTKLLPVRVYAATTQIDSIHKTTGGQYSTIPTWESDTDNDLVTAAMHYIGLVHIGAGDITSSSDIVFSGATTNSSCYRKLTAYEPDKHSGIDDGVTIIVSGSSREVVISEDYFVLDYMNIQSVNSHAVYVTLAEETTVSNCVIHDSYKCGYYSWETDNPTAGDNYIYNCFFWLNSWAAVYADAYSIHVYNCSVYDCGDNDANAGAICAKRAYVGAVNCISYNSEGNAFFADNANDGKWLDETGWNISNDATAAGGFSRGSVTITDYFTNVSAGTEDLHLYQSCYAINRGKFLNNVFTTDIDGDSRGSQSGLDEDVLNWDIGADEASYDAIPFDIVYVRPAGSSAWSTKDQNDVYCTIDSALDSAGTYGQVWVAEGRYQENVDIPANRYLYGGFLGTETELGDRGVNWRYMTRSVIDGSGNDDCVVDMGSNTVIDGFKCVYGYGDPQGAGIRAVGTTITTVTARNCLIESCRVAGVPGTSGGQGGAILFDSEDGVGVMIAKNCIARACTAYCGAIEVMEGSNTQVNFINCIAVDNYAYGIEISVDAGENPPDNTNHVIRNCISLGNKCPRSSCGTSTAFWSWAKDSAYMTHCLSDGASWSSDFYTEPASSVLFLSSVGSVAWFDSVGGDYRLGGGSPCINTGDPEWNAYMGPFAPLMARVITSQ